MTAVTGSAGLKGLADIALKMARASLEKEKTVTPVFILGYADGTTKELPHMDRIAELMNDGHAKDLIFGAVRKMVVGTGAVSCIFATEAWRGRTTEAANAIPKEELMKLCREKGFETAIKRGLMEREESIIVTAQDKDIAVLISQSFRRLANRTPYSYGEPETMEVPQNQFGGRGKMFGDA